MEIHLDGGGKGSGRFLDDGGIRQAVPEHGRTVYRYTITVIPLLGFIEGSWGVIRDVVVRTGVN